MRRALILSAGKSERLSGRNKLEITAGGIQTTEWHRRLLTEFRTAAVVPVSDAANVAMFNPWIDRVVSHSKQDGPVGALKAYLDAYQDDDGIVVLFADTLLPPQPLPAGDWVGVANSPQRKWDFPGRDSVYLRGTLSFPVCVGIYSFAWMSKLREAISEAIEDAHIYGESDVPMVRVLNRYTPGTYQMYVRGWHDAGDPEAISRVPAWSDVLYEEPDSSEVSGIIPVRWSR